MSVFPDLDALERIATALERIASTLDSMTYEDVDGGTRLNNGGGIGADVWVQ